MVTRKSYHSPQPAHVRRARYVSFKMKPLTLIFCGLTALGVCGWSGVVTTYAFFRDDVLMELVSRQNSMDTSYKDKINTLRAEIDTLQSQRMVERATFSDRLELLHKQQAVLEQRHSALTSLVGLPAPMAALEKNDDDNLTTGVVPTRSKPKPLGESIGTEPLGGEGDLGLRRQSSYNSRPHTANPSGTLAELEGRFSRLKAEQNKTTEQLSSRYGKLRDIYTDAYGTLALTPKALKSNANSAMGGPFIPASAASGDAFTMALQKASDARLQAVALRNGLRDLPLHNPAPHADYTSSFGMRSDPFLGTMAFHSGIDFRVSTGTPIRATAAGTVTVSGWNGGYGNMVEVDHGNGYTTRYGHLSTVSPQVGDKVNAGDVIGLSGSTGRSTGPHLHYETRINDQAVNPEKFLKVARSLEGLL